MHISSILFVELLGGIGDLLAALPAMHALALTHPGAEITALTFVPGSELLEGDPLVRRVVGVEHGEPAGDGRSRAFHAVARLLASRPFDLVVSDAMCDGIDQLVRSVPGRAVANLWRRPPANTLIQRRFLQILADEGLIDTQFRDLPCRITVDQTALRWAKAWCDANLVAGAPVVFLNLGAGMKIKRWPAASFVAVGRALQNQHAAALVLLGEDDPADEQRLVSLFRPEATILPRVDLPRLAAVLSLGALCVSTDTGPARIAVSVGTPTVCLYGPTWAGRYGLPSPGVNIQSPFVCPELMPHNFTEQRCWYSGQCIYPERANCLQDIPIATVVAAADQLLCQRKQEEVSNARE